MKLLLHICCAPCTIGCLPYIPHDITGFWYNPNIHPYTEYQNRFNETDKLVIPVIKRDEYGLRAFITATTPNIDSRCEHCYYTRLDVAAKMAKEQDFEAFSTTLLISPYQNHELIIRIANNVSKKNDIPFYYQDLRPYFRDGQAMARKQDFYMQKYCGCIFSEEERYK